MPFELTKYKNSDVTTVCTGNKEGPYKENLSTAERPGRFFLVKSDKSAFCLKYTRSIIRSKYIYRLKYQSGCEPSELYVLSVETYTPSAGLKKRFQGYLPTFRGGGEPTDLKQRPDKGGGKSEPLKSNIHTAYEHSTQGEKVRSGAACTSTRVRWDLSGLICRFRQNEEIK